MSDHLKTWVSAVDAADVDIELEVGFNWILPEEKNIFDVFINVREGFDDSACLAISIDHAREVRDHLSTLIAIAEENGH